MQASRFCLASLKLTLCEAMAAMYDLQGAPKSDSLLVFRVSSLV